MLTQLRLLFLLASLLLSPSASALAACDAPATIAVSTEASTLTYVFCLPNVPTIFLPEHKGFEGCEIKGSSDEVLELACVGKVIAAYAWKHTVNNCRFIAFYRDGEKRAKYQYRKGWSEAASACGDHDSAAKEMKVPEPE